jgi:hypothetical protein
MAEVVECLLCKCEALSSNPSLTKNKSIKVKKKKKKKKKLGVRNKGE